MNSPRSAVGGRRTPLGDSRLFALCSERCAKRVSNASWDEFMLATGVDDGADVLQLEPSVILGNRLLVSLSYPRELLIERTRVLRVRELHAQIQDEIYHVPSARDISDDEVLGAIGQSHAKGVANCVRGMRQHGELIHVDQDVIIQVAFVGDDRRGTQLPDYIPLETRVPQFTIFLEAQLEARHVSG
eukprot:scaffold7335_cov289-Pinguiococcus_pyrenoidosus.AAC.2